MLLSCLSVLHTQRGWRILKLQYLYWFCIFHSLYQYVLNITLEYFFFSDLQNSKLKIVSSLMVCNFCSSTECWQWHSLCVVSPCSQLCGYQYSWETCCLHLQPSRFRGTFFSEDDGIKCPGTLVPSYLPNCTVSSQSTLIWTTVCWNIPYYFEHVMT